MYSITLQLFYFYKFSDHLFYAAYIAWVHCVHQLDIQRGVIK